ncbi:MAG: FecR domain-containing protein [Treponema sp.]|nr:FecR domain-containing protein [Treponema sp.]
MKKKIRFRLKNDLAVPFWIVISICLIGAGISYGFFHASFFRALEKMNEEPIATITFKYKTAQRRFLERVVWDRLKQNSPVYNGDTIHTANLSEATIWFDDGTTLDLAENTMAQVFQRRDGSVDVDLEDGTATVDSTESGKAFTFSFGGKTFSVKNGTKISAQSKNGESNFIVQKGKIILADGTEFDAGKSFSINQNGEAVQTLSVTSPLPDEKILTYTDNLCAVDFAWNGPGSENLTLKIAADKNFSIINETIDVSGQNGTSLNLPKGTYYWQLSSGDGKGESKSGRLQIIQALKPSLVAPAKDYSYQYRKKSPSVRFIWTESSTATAYNFVISKSPSMTNPVVEQRSATSSIIISTLGEGTYYWQVTPYYVVNRIGLANPSDVSSFKIDQRGDLIAPTLHIPGNGEFVDKSKNSITFSWSMEDEARSFKIAVSSNQNMSSPIISRETNNNYITVSGKDLENLKDGQYYWTVSQVDSEGNESPKSKTRQFYALNGKIEQRTIFPPNNYRLWKPLLNDTRFTWKTNVTIGQHIQIARDSGFANIVFDSETFGSSFSGLNLAEGTYWWRIVAREGNFQSATDGKQFFVVPEINAPDILNPTETNRAVVRPAQRYTINWRGEEGANYYRLKLFKSNGEMIFDENFIAGTSYPIVMDAYEEGIYRIELQAYSYENETSSRRSSKLRTGTFALRKIKPVTLISPNGETEIDGWDAIENPPYFEWNSAEPFSRAEIVLRKVGDLSMQQVIPQNGYRHQLPQLSAGTYEWTVKAFTTDSLDISAERTFRFNVKPIPPFEKPGDAKTEGGNLFNAEYLRRTPYIIFSWNSVPRAYSYIFEIFNEKNDLLVREVLDGNDNTRFELKNLATLAKGNFRWTVKGVRIGNDGNTVLIDGESSENTFTIDYTMNSDGGNRKHNGEFYAQ